MGKKPQRFTWPEAKKRCRLNQLDIEMATRLGFGPDALIHAIPSPQQQWKLPVKYWVHELHNKRFGHVLGEKEEVVQPPEPLTPEEIEDEVRRFGEELYWEDYRERNAEDHKKGRRKEVVSKPAPQPADDSGRSATRDPGDNIDTPF